jgi:hypothetical protein
MAAAQAAYGPDALRVHLYVAWSAQNRGPLESSAGTFRSFVDGDGAAVSIDGASIRMEGTRACDASRCSLRDFLLRRTPLPGFGLIPPDWLNADARRFALLNQLVAVARDAEGVRRLLRAHKAAHGSVPGTVYGGAMIRLANLIKARAAEGALSAADVDAAHDDAQVVLSSSCCREMALSSALYLLAAAASAAEASMLLPSAHACVLLPLVLRCPYGRMTRSVHADAVLWLFFSCPSGDQPELCAFMSEPGVPAFLMRVLEQEAANTELARAADAAGVGEAGASGQTPTEWALVAHATTVLIQCVHLDADAVVRAGGGPRMARAVLLLLRMCGGLQLLAPALLIPLYAALHNTLMAASTPEHADVIAQLAASPALEQAAREMRAADAAEPTWHAEAGVWLEAARACVCASPTWPGGSAALAARARACDAVGALAHAVAALRRMGAHAHVIAVAVDALAAMWRVLGDADAPDAELRATAAASAAVGAVTAQAQNAEQAAAEQPVTEAAEPPAQSEPPASLRVRLHFLADVPLRSTGAYPLSKLLDGTCAYGCSDVTYIRLEGTPDCAAPSVLVHDVLLRDVLLRKAPLPGFGLLPAHWVSAEMQRTALLHERMLTAPDRAAVQRVLRVHQASHRRVPGDVLTDAMIRLQQFVMARAAEGAWSSDDAATANVDALDALRDAHGDYLLRRCALRLLAAVAHVESVMPPPRVPLAMGALLPHVMRATLELKSAGARHDAMSWMYLCSSGTEETRTIMANSPGIVAFLMVIIQRETAELEQLTATAEDPWHTLLGIAALLAVCMRVGTDAVAHAGGALPLLHAVLAALRLQGVPPSVADVLCMTLCAAVQSAVLQPDLTDRAAALEALAASQALELAVSTLSDGTSVAERVSAAGLWCGAADMAAAWPGGTAMLVQRALAAGVDAALARAVTTLRRLRADADSISIVAAAHDTVRGLLQSSRGAATERAAAELLAQEEAAAAQAGAKAARKAGAKAAKRAAAAAQAEAAAAAAATAEAAAAKARADAAAAAAAAAAARQRQQQVERWQAQEQAREQRRRELEHQQWRQLQRAHASAAAQPAVPTAAAPPPPPNPPPTPTPAPAPADASEERSSDALLAELFPWMRMHGDVPPAPAAAAPAQAVAPASAAAPGGGSDDGDDGSCAICLDAERTTALVPCGHALLCAACADKVLRTAAPACPVCRVTVIACRPL